jgi:hypothetical protein
VSFLITVVRAVIEDACEHCLLDFRDTERNFSYLAGYVPISNSFSKNSHLLSQLPSFLSEDVAAEFCPGRSKRVLYAAGTISGGA